jgi:hypothetical protein
MAEKLRGVCYLFVRGGRRERTAAMRVCDRQVAVVGALG